MIPDAAIQIILLIVGVLGSGTVYYFLSQKRLLAALWTGVVAAVLLLLGIAGYLHNSVVRKGARSAAPIFHGRLSPADDSAPWVPAGAYSLMLGDNLQVLTRSSDQHVFTRHGKAFLKLRVANHALHVSAAILDNRGDHVVRIIDNEFQASQERAFNPSQPDDHTLIVRDLDGIEVLNVRYMNPKVVRLTGVFQLPGFTGGVHVTDEGVRWPDGGGIGYMTLDLREAPDIDVIQF